MQNMEWYHSLNQPPIHPPDWVFAPVWSILYILMFLSLFLFLESETKGDKAVPLAIFVIQLLLNLSWSPVFFGFQNIEAALIILAMLWIFVSGTVICFYKYSKLSALLMLPYFLWTSFALYLNYQLFRLN